MKPSREMIKWVNSVFPKDPIDLDVLDEKHDNLDVFLLPEFESIEDAEAWLKKNYRPFLNHSLGGWVSDEDSWPQPLNWELFEKLNDYTLESVVIDTVEEAYDEAFDEEDLSVN